jgi:hypothetical protein
MQKRFDRGSAEAQMLVDFVNLIQNYYIVEKTDEYIDAYMKEMYAFADKYKNVNKILSERLGLAILDYIEDTRKEM